MTNWTEKTWTLPLINQATKRLIQSYVQYPPRKMQSETYPGPISIPQYERFKELRSRLQEHGIDVPLPN